MTSDLIAKIVRGFCWLATLLLSFALGAAIAFIPLSLLPGPLNTDFVHGTPVKLTGLGFIAGLLIWRLTPVFQQVRFSIFAARKFLWLSVSGFAMAFWPVGLAVWFNSYNVATFTVHEMIITGVESIAIDRAVSSIESFKMRELATGWEAELEVTDQRKQLLTVGRCVKILVRPGRLGLDWIDDVRPMECFASRSK